MQFDTWTITRLIAVVIASVVPATAGAQEMESMRNGVGASLGAYHSAAPATIASVPSSLDPLTVTLASAVIPGSGQLLLRQKRAIAYLALEAGALAFYVTQTREGRRERARYRQISRDVARAQFNPGGPRGNWDYYERMGKFVESGAFDAVPGGAIDPEPNGETYNGSVWLLARQTYWRDPDVPPGQASSEHAAAIQFYEERAVAPDMRWSWLGQPQAFQQFRSAIEGSNSAFRSAGATASIVLANHFLSAVDAYVSVQMRLRRNPDESVSVTASVPFGY